MQAFKCRISARKNFILLLKIIIKKRRLVICIFSVIFLISLAVYFIKIGNFLSYEPWDLSCFDDTLRRNTLEELNEREVEVDRSVWFLVTGCLPVGKPLLTMRQACSVESAARLNPQRHIYVLTPSPVQSLSQQFFYKDLSAYSNIRFRRIDLNRLFKYSPLEEKWNTDKMGLTKSFWPMVHASDIFRFTLLWKFGGIYSDLDVLFFEGMDDGGFVSAESGSKLGSSVISLPRKSVAVELSVLSLRDDYRYWHWSHNGPDLVTRVIFQLCNSQQIRDIVGKICYGIKVLPSSAYFPIDWNEFPRIVTKDKKDSDELLEEVRGSSGIHLWNSQTRKTEVRKGSVQPLSRLMAEACPKVYSSIPDGSVI